MTDQHDWTRVGDAIGERIDSLGLTKAEVGRRANLSFKTLQRYLDGNPVVRIDKKRDLCAALEWPRDAIERVLAGEDPATFESLKIQVGTVEAGPDHGRRHRASCHGRCG